MTGHANIDAIREHAATRDRIDYLPDDPDQVRRLRKLMVPLRWDVTMGALVLWIVSATFMMAGAAVLYPMLQRGELDASFQGFSLLTDQAFIWRESRVCGQGQEMRGCRWHPPASGKFSGRQPDRSVLVLQERMEGTGIVRDGGIGTSGQNQALELRDVRLGGYLV